MQYSKLYFLCQVDNYILSAFSALSGPFRCPEQAPLSRPGCMFSRSAGMLSRRFFRFSSANSLTFKSVLRIVIHT